MTDKELKHMLKNAYELPESGGSQRFIKEHEKRSRQLSDVIKNEFYYMGIKSILAGFILCGFEHCIADMFYFGMAWCWNPDMIFRLMIITLGNVVGGLLLPGLTKLSVAGKK